MEGINPYVPEGQEKLFEIEPTHDVLSRERLKNLKNNRDQILEELSSDSNPGVIELLKIITEIDRIHESDRESKKHYGLTPRDELEERLNAEFSQVERRREKGLESEMVIINNDLDNFKPINDLCGEDIGDIAMSLYAEVLKTEKRDTDEAGFISHGDETLIVMPDTDLEGAEIMISRFRLALLKKSLNEFVPVAKKALTQQLAENKVNAEGLESANRALEDLAYLDGLKRQIATDPGKEEEILLPFLELADNRFGLIQFSCGCAAFSELPTQNAKPTKEEKERRISELKEIAESRRKKDKEERKEKDPTRTIFVRT